MNRKKKNYSIYALLLLVFGLLIYAALSTGEKFLSRDMAGIAGNIGGSAFGMFKNIIFKNLHGSLTVLLFQIIVILITVRIFSYLFRYIGQPGVIGEIVAGIALGPSVLGLVFPEFFQTLFPAGSLTNLELLSQIGLVLFMFVIGMDVDFSILKNKMNETLVISHAGIVVPFFLGIVASFWVYEEYAAGQTDFLPFALFIGISMSITAFPVLARIIQERNMTKTPIGVLSIASAANDDVTAWCLLAIVIAVAKAGTFLSALYTIGITLFFIVFMFGVIRPFLRKIGDLYANAEVINKTFVGFIFLVLLVSSVSTEVIGIHALFGAFIAGVVMPVNPGFRKVMMEKVEDIALVFFLPLFFAFTGLRTEIGLINTPALWGGCALLIFVAILGKLGGCTLAARLVGESWKDSFIVGTLMNTRGLMELVALNIGYEMGVLPPEIFVILVLMALVTTFMTTPLLHLIEKVFRIVPSRATSRPRLLLSFGRPESGQTLLQLAACLLGKERDHTEIVAAHYTVGTDVNPANARQYALESFEPILREASRLNLHVEERYKVTDRLVYDMNQLVKNENAHLLLMGAGPRFMQATAAPVGNSKSPVYMYHRLAQEIQNQSFRLSGNLLKDKMHDMIEEAHCPVVVFVNRNYEEARQFFLLVDSEEDLILPILVRKFFPGNESVIQICFLTSTAAGPFMEEKINELIINHPQHFARAIPLAENPVLQQPGNLLLLSYETCSRLARSSTLFHLLPSLLVIHPGKK